MLNIQVKPLNEMSLEEIVKILNDNMDNLEALVNQYPTILKVYLQKRGLTILGEVDDDTVNMALLPELKRIVTFFNSNCRFMDNGDIKTIKGDLLLQIDRERNLIIIQIGNSYTCNVGYITLENALLGITKQKFFSDSRFVTDLDNNDLHQFVLLYSPHMFRYNSLFHRMKAGLIDENYYNRVCANYPQIDNIYVNSFFVYGTELFKNVKESMYHTKTGKRVEFESWINVSNTGPYILENYYMDSDITVDEAKFFGGIFGSKKILNNRYFNNGGRNLIVSQLPPFFNKGNLISNLQQNRNHPFFLFSGSNKWYLSKDEHTRYVAQLCKEIFNEKFKEGK
ncbi:MAG: hypothetical protein IKM97_04215 [Clostridia bacterium]|nr:hypothetical protein [Clostridia bacterium]